MKKSVCIYYGPTLTDSIVRSRKLPTLFTATTNRMTRIASALNTTDVQCLIVSSGIQPRLSYTRFLLRGCVERVRGNIVLTVAQLGVKWIGYMLTPLTAVVAVARLARKRKIVGLIQYSFYPDAFIVGLFCKYVLRIPVVLDCEDISIPSLSDWKRGSETRPIQQLWASVLMRISIRFSNVVIVLSRKFLDVVPKNKALIISGCQKVPVVGSDHESKEKINLLLSGSITVENGMNVFADALALLDANKRGRNLRFYVCGRGKYNELVERLSLFRNLDVEPLGFLSNEEFKAVYDTIDVCFALENPTGRHGRYKVPSKAYEAICSGKVLIAGDMGDLGDLPSDICYHLAPYDAPRLYEILDGIKQDEIMIMRGKSREYAKKNFDLKCVGASLRNCFI